MSLLEDLKNKLFTRESRGLFQTTNNNNNNNTIVTTRYSKSDKINPNVNYTESIKILEDDQVKVAYSIFKHILSSKKYNISSTQKGEEDEVALFIDDMFKNMNVEIIDIVHYLLTGVLYGYSANELMFNVNNEQKLVVTDVIPIDQSTLEDNPFNFNKDGDVVSIHQTPLQGKPVDIPVDKILLYSYDSLFNNPYGRGVLRQLKPIVREKRDLNEWAMTDAKRHTSPIMVGKSENPVSRKAMLDAFDDINAGATGIICNTEESIESIGGNGSADDYRTRIEMKNNQILRLFFIPDLLMASNNTGSYAQSQTQLTFLYKIYNGILEDIANIIQRQIINPIIKFNYGEETLPPVFSFDKFDDTDYQQLFGIINGLINNGILGSDDSSVHELIGKMFRTNDIEYNNKDNDNGDDDGGLFVEDFRLPPVDGETATEDILTGIGAGSP